MIDPTSIREQFERDESQLGSAISGDPGAPAVGDTECGTAQIGGLYESQDGRGEIVPDAALTRFEIEHVAAMISGLTRSGMPGGARPNERLTSNNWLMRGVIDVNALQFFPTSLPPSSVSTAS